MAPFEIVAAPLTLWAAPVGTAFPLIGAAPAVAWVKIGTNGDRNYDDSGIEVTHTQKTEDARPAGATGPIKAWRTEEDMMLSLTLWDMTVEQYRFAMNAVTITTVAAGVGTAGTKKIGLSRGVDVVTYALLARGLASGYGDTFNAQYELPIVYQSGNAKPVFKKGKPAGLALEFTALEDVSAASAAERFGRLLVQHQAPLQ
jgi:hypothetical protein